MTKAVVLDTNELARDWPLIGLKYQLIEHMFHQTWMDFYVPRVVFEELVANHARAVANVLESSGKINRERKRLGLAEIPSDPADLDYRGYLTERFDERLSFTILDWPTVPHEQFVRRAVNRIRPFDAKGGGYRDALVWEDVVGLARSGRDVALVSMDRAAFAGEDGQLAPELEAEVESLSGSVELVRDFGAWLTAQLPWGSVPDLSAAVQYSRTSEFYGWYLQSDFQDGLAPTVEELGIRAAPYSLEIVDVVWDGDFIPLDGTATDNEGLALVEYDLGQTVAFEAEFPAGIEIAPDWRSSEPDPWGRVRVEGSIEMFLRVAVLYGGEYGFSVDELSWRRRDGSGLGSAARGDEPDPNQPTLFDE